MRASFTTEVVVGPALLAVLVYAAIGCGTPGRAESASPPPQPIQAAGSGGQKRNPLHAIVTKPSDVPPPQATLW